MKLIKTKNLRNHFTLRKGNERIYLDVREVNKMKKEIIYRSSKYSIKANGDIYVFIGKEIDELKNLTKDLNLFIEEWNGKRIAI